MEEAKVLTESFGIMDLLSRPRRDQWGIWNEKKRGMEVSKIVDFDTENYSELCSSTSFHQRQKTELNKEVACLFLIPCKHWFCVTKDQDQIHRCRDPDKQE